MGNPRGKVMDKGKTSRNLNATNAQNYATLKWTSLTTEDNTTCKQNAMHATK